MKLGEKKELGREKEEKDFNLEQFGANHEMQRMWVPPQSTCTTVAAQRDLRRMFSRRSE